MFTNFLPVCKRKIGKDNGLSVVDFLGDLWCFAGRREPTALRNRWGETRRSFSLDLCITRAYLPRGMDKTKKSGVFLPDK